MPVCFRVSLPQLLRPALSVRALRSRVPVTFPIPWETTQRLSSLSFFRATCRSMSPAHITNMQILVSACLESRLRAAPGRATRNFSSSSEFVIRSVSPARESLSAAKCAAPPGAGTRHGPETNAALGFPGHAGSGLCDLDPDRLLRSGEWNHPQHPGSGDRRHQHRAVRRHRRLGPAHVGRSEGRLSKSRNLLLSAVVFVVGISGVSINIGTTQLTGMVLATLVGMAR